MNLLGLEISWAKKEALSLDTFIKRLEAAMETASGVEVTPENCMRSPTVHAVVTGVARRISTLPVHILAKSENGGRASKERLPNHPVAKLLARPNFWQARTNYWQDAVSSVIRYGNFYAYKSRGQTGPIRELLPLVANTVTPDQRDDYSLIYKVNAPGGRYEERQPNEMHHVRGPARDFVVGDSPIVDCRDSIALEIAAESFGGSFFGNGAMPGMIFEFMDGFIGFKTDEERRQFIEDFQAAYGKKGRFRALLMPQGIKVGESVPVDNEKAQFLDTRKLQRNIIAGLLGVPPHTVGDLERATFSNIEEQSLDFVRAAILPIARQFEDAMERDLLTDEDRRGGIIIRFNLDGALRADFKSRQEGQQIMRQNGVINANDWRENENLNPISAEDGGEEFWRQGPSGQSASSPDGGPTQ